MLEALTFYLILKFKKNLINEYILCIEFMENLIYKTYIFKLYSNDKQKYLLDILLLQFNLYFLNMHKKYDILQVYNLKIAD